jgi:uncharacterized protein YcfJ
MRALHLLLIEVASLALSAVAHGQAPPPASSTAPAAQPHAATVAPTSHALGVIVYPAKNQSAQQQSVDESECYNWAKSHTGIDPTAPPPAPAEPAEGKPKGERAKSAARGAAAGAVIGEVANDDASEGAKVGAAAGVVAGGRRSREQERAAAESSKASQQAAQEQQLSTFRKAFGTCLTGKGYSTG